MNKIIFAALVLASAGAVQAQVVFSNFGSNPPGYYAFGWSVYDLAGSGYQEVATAFTPSASVQLQSVDLALGATNLGYSPSSFTLEVFADSAGAPGTLLGTSGVETAVNSYAGPDVQNYDLSGLNISLVAGLQYWLDAVPTSGSLCAWSENNGTDNSTFYYKPDPTSTFLGSGGQDGAFDVMGSPVPEPRDLIGIFGGFGLLAILRRRK